MLPEVKVFRLEKWRRIPSTAYIVSSLGRVKSLGTAKRPRGGLLKCGVRNDGYRYVTLYFGHPGRNSGRKVKVAVLVLTAFRGSACGRLSCHRNGDSTDDRLSNLYWGTSAQNVNDAIRHGTFPRGERSGHAKLTDTQVREILYAPISGSEAARLYGVSAATISAIRSGQRRVT